MGEKTKYDIMCLERGDIEYIRHAADVLLSDEVRSNNEVENIAYALLGVANAAYELDKSSLIDLS